MNFRVLFNLMLCLFLSNLAGFAQKKDDYNVYGTIKDQSTRKLLADVEIVITKDGKHYDKVMVGKSGKYDVWLPLGSSYELTFGKQGYVAKKLRFDTQTIPVEDRKGGFENMSEVNLFELKEGFDTSILDKPVGIFSFNSAKNSFDFDENYTMGIVAEVQAEFKRLDDLAKNYEKMKKQFDELIVKGDNRVNEKNYAEAISNYEKALGIFPKDEPAKEKLEKAKGLLAAQNAEKNKDAEYQKLIADGETQLKNKNWEPAKQKFEAALALKPDEKLPKDKLKEIEAALAALNKKAEFDKLVTEGDKLFEQKKWEECIAKYEAAKALIPTEKHPPEQIAKAKKALDDLMADENARKEREKKYNEWVAQGDKNFKDKNYETAKKNFEEAQRIWSEPRYPQDKIDEINGILADLASKAEKDKAANDAEAEKKRIEAEYKALIEKADGEFTKDQLWEARGNYVAASELKPQEKYPKSRITRIDELLADKEKNDEVARKEREKREKEEAARLAAEADKAEKDRLAEEARQKKLADEDAERQRLAEEKRRKEEELAEKQNKKRNLKGGDQSMEEEAERYYREARQDEWDAHYQKVLDKKTNQEEFYASKDGAADDKRKTSATEANNQKDQMVVIHRDGNLKTDESRHAKDREKETLSTQEQHWRQREESVVNEKVTESTNQKASVEALSLGDLHRINSISDTNQKKEQEESNKESWRSREGAIVADGVYDANKLKQQQEKLAVRGDNLRDDQISVTEAKKDMVDSFYKDATSAEQERISQNVDNASKLKQSQEKLSADKADYHQTHVSEIADKKDDFIRFNEDKQSEFALKRMQAAQDAHNVNTGRTPKNEDDYVLPEGGDKLTQGVNETSYQIPGERMVIERTVRVGNKVDVYKKVISKNGTYYFKNDRSITEVTWRKETIEAFE
jgi:hypothetical protein